MWVKLCPVTHVLDDDVVEVSCDDKLYCAHRIAGQHYVTDALYAPTRWRGSQRATCSTTSSSAMHNGRFRSAFPSRNAPFRARDRATQTVRPTRGARDSGPAGRTQRYERRDLRIAPFGYSDCCSLVSYC